MRSAIVLGVLALSLSADALAQRSLTLVPGQRLRVTAPALGAYDYEVRYVATLGDTLILTAGSNVKYPLADVVRLEILKGHGSHKWSGAVIGLACGAVVGVALGYATVGEDAWLLDREDAMKWGGIGFGILAPASVRLWGKPRRPRSGTKSPSTACA